MGKGTILFVLIFTAALIYAKYREPPRVRTQTKPQQQPQSPIPKQIQEKPEWPKVIRMLITGYCPCKICCGKYADGLTSTGKNAWKTDGVAADLSLLPRNTELVIPGVDGIRVVDDTGGAMRKSAKERIYHIDVRFSSHEEAKAFGKKWRDVVVLGPAK